MDGWMYPCMWQIGRLNYIFRCEGTKILRDEFLDYSFRNIRAEMCVGRLVGCKNKEKWQKTGIYSLRDAR
jgi:hypothetical protein